MKKYYYNFERAYSNISRETGTEEVLTSVNKMSSSLQELVDKVLREGWCKGGEVLVVGCGRGMTCEYLNALGLKTTGIDISESAIRQAKEHGRGKDPALTPQYLLQDVTELDLGREFGLIIDDHCLHCLVFAQDRESYFQRLYQHLRPGGILILETLVASDDMQFSSDFLFDDEKILWCKTSHGDWPGVVCWEDSFYLPARKIVSAYDLEQEILSAGYKIKFFVYCPHLRMEIPGNLNIPPRYWPALMRAVLTRST